MIKIITNIDDFTQEYIAIRETLLDDILTEMQKCKKKRNYLGFILTLMLFILIEVIVALLLYPHMMEHMIWFICILLFVACFAIKPVTMFLFAEPDDEWKELSTLYIKYKKELDVEKVLDSLTNNTYMEKRAKHNYAALRQIEQLKDKTLETIYIENNKLVVNDVVFNEFSFSFKNLKGVNTLSLEYIDNKVEAVCH